MSVGENLAGAPGQDPEWYIQPLDMLAQLKECNADLRRIITIVSVSPCKQTMRDMYQAIDQAKGLISQLYESRFFKAQDNDMLISRAIKSLIDSIKESYSCIKTLLPNSKPRMEIEIEPTAYEEFDLPPIKVQTGAHDDAQDTRNTLAIDKYADFILVKDDRAAKHVSKHLQGVGYDAYDKLIEVLQDNPITMAYLQKEHRQQELITNAKFIGMIAAPAFLLSAAAADVAAKYL